MPDRSRDRRASIPRFFTRFYKCPFDDSSEPAATIAHTVRFRDFRPRRKVGLELLRVLRHARSPIPACARASSFRWRRTSNVRFARGIIADLRAVRVPRFSHGSCLRGGRGPFVIYRECGYLHDTQRRCRTVARCAGTAASARRTMGFVRDWRRETIAECTLAISLSLSIIAIAFPSIVGCGKRGRRAKSVVRNDPEVAQIILMRLFDPFAWNSSYYRAIILIIIISRSTRTR